MTPVASEGSAASDRLPGTLTKLPAIPQGSKIQKRPLTRRQPPASSKSRIVYVSSSTPFMAAVKRVRKQLDAGLRGAGPAPKNASLHARVEALRKDGGGAEGSGAAVTIMGTGRAVEKVLGLASWFEQQGDCNVEMRTRTVGTVDDVVVEDGDAEEESRVRKMSCLEVCVELK